MPYSPNHKAIVRQKITETARMLFNRHGFEKVTIDQVMEQAGLTRGGFYNHFSSKQELFQAAVDGFLMGRGAQWRDSAGINPAQLDLQAAQQMIDSYLSQTHLDDIEGQCPMIALPSDVARAGVGVQVAYQRLLEAMVYLFECSMSQHTAALEPGAKRQKALAMAALCVGGMVLARTLPDSALAEEVQKAAHAVATNQLL